MKSKVKVRSIKPKFYRNLNSAKMHFYTNLEILTCIDISRDQYVIIENTILTDFKFDWTVFNLTFEMLVRIESWAPGGRLALKPTGSGILLRIDFITYDHGWGHPHGPITRYVKLRVAHTPGTCSPPGTFSPKPLVSDPGMHHGTCITHEPRWMSRFKIQKLLFRKIYRS